MAILFYLYTAASLCCWLLVSHPPVSSCFQLQKGVFSLFPATLQLLVPSCFYPNWSKKHQRAARLQSSLYFNTPQ